MVIRERVYKHAQAYKRGAQERGVGRRGSDTETKIFPQNDGKPLGSFVFERVNANKSTPSFSDDGSLLLDHRKQSTA